MTVGYFGGTSRLDKNFLIIPKGVLVTPIEFLAEIEAKQKDKEIIQQANQVILKEWILLIKQKLTYSKILLISLSFFASVVLWISPKGFGTKDDFLFSIFLQSIYLVFLFAFRAEIRGHFLDFLFKTSKLPEFIEFEDVKFPDLKIELTKIKYE